MLGVNVDGRVGIYIGSSQDIRQRWNKHSADLLKGSADLYVHQVFEEEGWTVTCHFLIEDKDEPLWRYWMETIIMIRLDTVDPNHRSRFHPVSTATILNSVTHATAKIDIGSSVDRSNPAHSSLGTDSPVGGSHRAHMRLNRGLPIKQRVYIKAKQITGKRACHCCGDTLETLKWRRWFFYDENTPYDGRWSCDNCHSYAKRNNGMDRPERLMQSLKQYRESRASHCGSCGVELTPGQRGFIATIGMSLCLREYRYWRKWEILTPTPPPSTQKCQNTQCGKGRTHGAFLWWSPRLQIWHCGFMIAGQKDIRCIPVETSDPLPKGYTARRSSTLPASVDAGTTS